MIANHRKVALPNYAVFDEKRYFQPGAGATVAELGGHKLGLIICEDVWVPEPCRAPAEAGAEIILVINGSPFHHAQQQAREQVLAMRAQENSLPLVYVNMVGGQDELVFDGGSVVVDAQGRVQFRAPLFEEELYVVEFERKAGRLVPSGGAPIAVPPLAERVYRALVLGTRDYVEKNGFAGVVLGLSGGIDSALTLTIAVDALGADRVQAIMMPSRYTSQMSRDDAAQQASQLGVRYDVLSIEPLFETTLEVLKDLFAGLPPDATEENIQARCRGVLLMAISNKTGKMVLTTGNKSEMAVGYATLYGDMAGGFAPLQDCTKTLVYQLASYRNGVSARHPRARHHAAADGGASRQSKGQRLAAAVRRAGCDSRGVHREGLLGRADHGARFRARDGGARAADGEARGIQAPASAARCARQQPRVRPRLALPDHVRVLVVSRRAVAASSPKLSRSTRRASAARSVIPSCS